MIKTEAGEKMKEENPVDGIKTIDGQELLRQELEKQSEKFSMPEMNCGGLMGDGMGVIIGIEESSGNEIPAGSMPKEVADDIPAMLSEGEYVVPADVVRWHGLKHLEAMRQEAKMGLGIMAQDGRIAEVEVEESEKPEYEIEEDDKPEVEEAEVKVIEAAEGVSVEGTDVTEEIAAPTFYRYESRLNPDTGQYEIVPIDPDTGTVVTDAQFDPTRSTRYGTQTVLERDVYGRSLGGEEIPDCGEGFVYDEELGACVPEKPVGIGKVGGALTDDDGGNDGGPAGPSYNYTTEELDDALSGLYEDYAEKQQAIKDSQASLKDNSLVPGAVKALGAIVNAIRQGFTRNEYLGKVRAGEHLSTTLNPAYASWRDSMSNGLTGSVAITEYEAQQISSGARGLQDAKTGWSSSFATKGEADAVANDGWGSGFDTEEDTGHLGEIEKGFDFTGTTPSTPGDPYGNYDSDNDGGGYDPGFDSGDTGDTGGSLGGGYDGGFDDGDTGDTGGGTGSASDAGGEDDNTSGSFASGGMPVKKNTPKKAMIKYSKGSK